MSRIIAIDYGKKRTGIAVSDTLQMIANGLTTVPTHELLAFITDYVAKEPVERILVGLPKQMNNEASENMKRIEPFVRSLQKRLPDMPVEYVDERFTSVLAHRTTEKERQAEQGAGGRNQRDYYPADLSGEQALLLFINVWKIIHNS